MNTQTAKRPCRFQNSKNWDSVMEIQRPSLHYDTRNNPRRYPLRVDIQAAARLSYGYSGWRRVKASPVCKSTNAVIPKGPSRHSERVQPSFRTAVVRNLLLTA